jgi:hypothetical protein
VIVAFEAFVIFLLVNTIVPFHEPWIFHFLLVFKLFPIIIAHQDEIIDVNNNEKIDIFNLRNIHIKVHITFHKFDDFQYNI